MRQSLMRRCRLCGENATQRCHVATLPRPLTPPTRTRAASSPPSQAEARSARQPRAVRRDNTPANRATRGCTLRRSVWCTPRRVRRAAPCLASASARAATPHAAADTRVARRTRARARRLWARLWWRGARPCLPAASQPASRASPCAPNEAGAVAASAPEGVSVGAVGAVAGAARRGAVGECTR